MDSEDRFFVTAILGMSILVVIVGLIGHLGWI